ncbi:CHU large protein [Filimonas lacunae]|nr:CHU large protein [Filimonas lacunae]
MVVLSGSFSTAWSQVDYSIGNTTNGSNYAQPNFIGFALQSPCPLQDYRESSRAQYLYLASELQAAGMLPGEIQAIKFTVSATNGADVIENLVFKIGGTSVTALSNTSWETISNAVSTSAQDYFATDGVNTFTLPVPFIWNGTDNIIIEMCNGSADAATSVTNSVNNSVTWSMMSFNCSHNYAANDLAAGSACGTNATTESGYSQMLRPNIIFNWYPTAVCDGSFGEGTVVSSATSVCGTGTVNLSWSGTLAKGMTYQWQKSPDNNTANFTDISGATSFTYTTGQNASTYYRLKITCGNGGAVKYTPGIQITSPAQVNGTFTINNSVTASDPVAGVFKSFNDAYNYIKCGINGPIVFNVVNTGTTYTEQLKLYEVVGASATNTITFNGNGATIAYTSTNTNERAVIKLNGADYFIFDNLKVTATGTTSSQYGFGFHLLNDADYNVVKNCTISMSTTTTSENYAGIVVNSADDAVNSYDPSYCDYNTFDHNTIIGGTYGVGLFSAESSAIQHNTISNNTFKNFYQYGIYFSYNYFLTIEGNDFSRPDRTASTTQTYGIYGFYISSFVKVNKNRFHTFFAAQPDNTGDFIGIRFHSVDGEVGNENIVSNNLIYDIVSRGKLFGIYSSYSDAAFYFYNTISFDDVASTATLPTYGFYQEGQSGDLVYKNNIVSITRTGAGKKYAMYFATPETIVFTTDYNNLHVASHPTCFTGYINNAEVKTLADWKIASAQDAHSTDGEPGFTDIAGGNFQPTSVLLMDKGTPVSITTDVLGATRSTTKPDIGSYEYNLPGCTTGFSAGTAYATSGNTSCSNKQVTLNLKNYDLGAGLTFTWESSPNGTNQWTAVSGDLEYPAYTFVTGTQTLYYRCAVSCNGGTPVRSTVAQITIGASFPAGTYTIDKTQPTDPAGSKNFASFKEAVAAISCGIAGPIVFDVKAGTYAEQIRIAEIPGASATNTVTFKSVDNNPATATLQYTSTKVAENYVVRLDSARFINFKALTVASTDYTYGVVFDIVNTAGNDSILNCVINAPVALTKAETCSGIYAATGFVGGNLVIKGNTIKNGAKGVFVNGATTTDNSTYATVTYSSNNIIESNTFTGTYDQAVYVANTSRLRVFNNTITINSANVNTNYGSGTAGIFVTNSDTALVVTGNNITISNNKGYVYGIALTYNNNTAAERGKVLNNKVVAVEGQTMRIYGLTSDHNSNMDVMNNTVSVASTVSGSSNGSNTVALQTLSSLNINYYNNTFINSSTKTGVYNVACYVDHQYGSEGGNVNMKNNVFANIGGGPALHYLYNPYQIKSDYNLIYSTGAVLIKQSPSSTDKNYANLAAWIADYAVDMHSIVYEPGIVSNKDVQPDVTNEKSWAMQGRGVQIAGNNVDINGNARSTTLLDGVPDLGAYEFLPTVAPPALTATPATPAAGTTQVFNMGSDTVMKITWGASVPTAVTMKRYSGVLPDGLAATEKSMYYYVDADVTGAGTYQYNVQQYYIDPWLRNVTPESVAKVGKTDATGKWVVNANSKIDSLLNILSDVNQDFLDKFTGLTDGKAPEKPVVITTPDSTTAGTRFWIPYPNTQSFWYGNGQVLKLYLGAQKATTATVTINGTSYSKTYTIPAGGVTLTSEIPKSGEWDARILTEGLSNRAILVESADPITVNVDIPAQVSSNILPTGTYSKEYTALGYNQISSYNSGIATSFVEVVADNDNTVVQITPSAATAGGRVAGVPFQVTLNRGEIYQVQGAFKTYHADQYSYECYDLTGTRVVSVPNSKGDCFPIAVFSGSSSSSVRCADYETGSELPLYQQNMPATAWGKHFLYAPMNTSLVIGETMYHIYRIQVKDPATVVKRNGTVLTGLQNNNYYQFLSNEAEAIDADKPVMVAQIQTWLLDCMNDISMESGSRESLLYLTPLGNGVNKSTLFRKYGTGRYGWTGPLPAYNYITVVLPNEGLTSLKIDGSNTFDNVITHPANAAYSVVTKRWASKDTISQITCDTLFTGTAYMPGSPTSAYSYNVGYQVPRVKLKNDAIVNQYNTSDTANAYACVGTGFKPVIALPVAASALVWKLSSVSGVTPATDITVKNPVAIDTVEMDFKDYYVYQLNQNVEFSSVGTYSIPVTAAYVEATGSCERTVDGAVHVKVVASPVADFAITYSGCVNTNAQYNGSVTSAENATAYSWTWKLGDTTTAYTQQVTKMYTKGGTYNVVLQVVTADGCAADTTKKIMVNAAPMADVISDSVGTCPGSNATFQIKDPVTNVTYNWYNTNAGGAAISTGTDYTATNVTVKQYYYIGTTLNGCNSDTMKRVVAYIIPAVAATVVEADSVGVYTVRFAWQAVTNATGYEVSTDNGLSWITPSSGATGLTHTISGLKPLQTVTLIVRALGGCEIKESNTATATTLSDKVFIPNSFTPNGDGKNDVLKVYSQNIKTLRFMVFNQWGEKVFETSDVSIGWNGAYNGKPQPSGVYMYVSRMELTTGEVVEKKGTINLVR